VLRKLSFLAVFASILVPWPAVHAQDQPSLGDVARQARKDKEKNATPAKTVVTEDNLSSSTSKGLGAVDLSAVAGSKTSGHADAANVNAALAGLAQGEAALDKLEPMDRATLARAVLSNNNVDFASRQAWEEKLFAAKQLYVARSRKIIQVMKQLLASAQTLPADTAANENDPRVKQLVSKAQQVQEAVQKTESDFQEVVAEGQNLARSGSPR
jgi:hypothetical protein